MYINVSKSAAYTTRTVGGILWISKKGGGTY